ncbi:MAG: pectate lyase, partial [Bryobacteraceae bacterium]
TQREATPAVGMALLEAWDATGDRYYLQAAQAAAMALVKGQHCSGGWDYTIEFDPAKRKRYPYRVDDNCAAVHRQTGATEWTQPYTNLDDNVTQACLRLMMRVDRELEFQDAKIHEAAQFALNKLIEAQYPNGAWAQRFHAPPDASKFPVKKASYPESWPRQWPGANYQLHYTFNDNSISDMIDMFLEAARTYKEPRYSAAAEKGGDFILLAQMPEPQPAWAQQYDVDMHPAWARIFEPPSVTGGESQGIMKTLLVLYQETGKKKYLDAVPPALEYLQRSALPPVDHVVEARKRMPESTPVMARFYELKTNKPLYITKGTRVNVQGKSATLIDGYQLSYSDESVITHYSVLTSGERLAQIAAEYKRLSAADAKTIRRPEKLHGLSPWNDGYGGKRRKASATQLREMMSSIDSRGAWLETGSIGKPDRVVMVYAAKDMVVKVGDQVLPLKENQTVEVFQGKDRPRERIIRSETFAKNVEALSAYVSPSRPGKVQ